MKGLLHKDILVVSKQYKIIFTILIAIGILASCMSNFAVIFVAVAIASAMPMTALAYDERSRWNCLELMLPCKRSDIVWSKYLLGYIFNLGIVLIFTIARLILSIFINMRTGTGEMMLLMLMIIAGGTLITAFLLPFSLKLGVEKARILNILIIATITVLASITLGMYDNPSDVSLPEYSLLLIPVALLINILSIVWSMNIMKKKTC